MDQKICYCFNYGEEEIWQDVYSNSGESIILNKIISAKRQNSCECVTKHPEAR